MDAVKNLRSGASEPAKVSSDSRRSTAEPSREAADVSTRPPVSRASKGGVDRSSHIDRFNKATAAHNPLSVGFGTVPVNADIPSRESVRGGTATKVILEVEVDQLADNPVNPRPGLSRREVNALVDTMRERGQLGSVQAWRAPEGSPTKFVLKEGHTRREAARLLGWKTVRVEVVEPPPDNRRLFQDSFALNEKRHKQTAVSNARSFAARLADGTYDSQQELAAAVGKDESEISRLRAIARLPEELLDAANEAPEDLGTMRLHLLTNRFEKLVATKGEAAALEQCSKYLGRIISERMTVQQVKRLLGDPDNAQAPAPSRQGAARRVVFKVGAQGRLSEYDDGSLKLELKLDKAKLTELGPKLLKLLEDEGISSEQSTSDAALAGVVPSEVTD